MKNKIIFVTAIVLLVFLPGTVFGDRVGGKVITHPECKEHYLSSFSAMQSSNAFECELVHVQKEQLAEMKKQTTLLEIQNQLIQSLIDTLLTFRWGI